MHRNPAALTEGIFDLLIIGGGIFGAGVARDAALRGLRVALVDKNDFASGTSSRRISCRPGGSCAKTAAGAMTVQMPATRATAH